MAKFIFVFLFFEGEGCQFGAGTLGGGEGFLKGLLFGEWVGGTVNFECKRIAVDGECGASRLMRIWVL